MKVFVSSLAAILALPVAAQEVVHIRVDTGKVIGPNPMIWPFFGYDEPNYTYMKDGRKLLSELSALSPVSVSVRTHNLLTTGDGTAALKWGSTNAYTEDANGNPHYDWTIVDRIFDTYVQRKMKPMVEIGFMPEALSSKPQPYRHHWDPSQPYSTIFTGWAQPPRDYRKWSELVFQWVKHCISRYGEKEVASWYWEVWNEPDTPYWQGTPAEYQKLYDYTADAVKRALPAIHVGGPASTGPANPRAANFLRDFLEHVVNGTNYATGRKGSPLDFITFHAKGRPKIVNGHVEMGSEFQLRDVDEGFKIVTSFQELKNLPIVITESDPEGCAACSIQYNPQNRYRNGTMYSSYTAATLARIQELADRDGVNLRGALTWAFEFENQPYFAGFRDLATNGIDKPVVNVFRMLGMMEGDRIRVESSGAVALEEFVDKGVKSAPDIDGVASRSANRISVLMWNYHDDDVNAPGAQVDLEVEGVPARRVLVRQYRVDDEHSNAYSAWKAFGSPQNPTPTQYRQLETAGQLGTMGPPQRMDTKSGELDLKLALPRQAVSLIQLSW
ncbi:MAG: beta-xylosidase [Terracidiphilus sp.]